MMLMRKKPANFQNALTQHCLILFVFSLQFFYNLMLLYQHRIGKNKFFLSEFLKKYAFRAALNVLVLLNCTKTPL